MTEINDLIIAVTEEKPHEFTKIFGELMQDRVSQLVADRKLSLAQSFFATEEDDKDDEEKKDDDKKDDDDKDDDEDKDDEKKEEVEQSGDQIDEISKKTLGSYVQKAGDSILKNRSKENIMKRTAGRSLAAKKMK